MILSSICFFFSSSAFSNYYFSSRLIIRLAIKRATNRPASMRVMNTPNTGTDGAMKTTKAPETSLSARKISAIFDCILIVRSAGSLVDWVQI